MWVIDDKSESLISNKRLGVYGGAIIVTASSILDVGSEHKGYLNKWSLSLFQN